MTVALKGALSGSLEHLILGLMKSTNQYDASEIKGSVKVMETDQHQCFEQIDDTALYWHTDRMRFLLLSGFHFNCVCCVFMCLFQGLGTDEETLIEILCSRSDNELSEIKKVYKECKFENIWLLNKGLIRNIPLLHNLRSTTVLRHRLSHQKGCFHQFLGVFFVILLQF